MADVFGNHKRTRGCFMAIKMNAAHGRGSVLSLPGSVDIPTGFGEPTLVTGFSTSLVDATTHVKTFGGNVYTYAFGHDPSQSVLDVSVTAFIGQDDKIVGKMLNAYRNSRVSKTGAKARFVVGNSPAISGYVIGQSSQTQSAELNLQVFTFRIALVEA
jgi:hypothetical protein